MEAGRWGEWSETWGAMYPMSPSSPVLGTPEQRCLPARVVRLGDAQGHHRLLCLFFVVFLQMFGEANITMPWDCLLSQAAQLEAAASLALPFVRAVFPPFSYVFTNLPEL